MIYAIANQKGGCGKSATAAAILSGATLRGRRALGVDMDGQANFTFSTGADWQKPGSYEIITGAADPAEVIQHTEQGDIIAAGPKLAAADTVLKGTSRTKGLRKALQKIRAEYDYIIIDSGPTLSTLLLNSLTAADRVIIPTGANVYTLQGLALLVQTIRQTRKEYNTQLHYAGLLFTMYSGRTNAERIYKQIIEDQAKDWRIPVFNTTIRRGVAVEEAAIYRESIFKSAPRSGPAKDYAAFLDELEI